MLDFKTKHVLKTIWRKLYILREDHWFGEIYQEIFLTILAQSYCRKTAIIEDIWKAEKKTYMISLVNTL